MEILFINPPFKSTCGKFSREQRSPAITKSGTFYYPMWMAYALGVLEDEGHVCRLIDAPAGRLNFEEVIQNLGDFRPKLIVVATSTPSIYNDVEVAVELKEKYTAFVILVGTHPSALPQQTLDIDKRVDAVAKREYEETLKELTKALEKSRFALDKSDLEQITGISFRWEEKVVHNPEREGLNDLDSIPFVSKIYKKHLNYRDYFYAHSMCPIVTVITGRGCPFRCVYCVYPQVFNGHKMRYRSIKNVVDEVEYILKEFPDIKEIMFEDDTLTVNKKRCIEFAEEILRRNLKFTWSANSSTDVDLETMKILKKAGARLFCVGIESGVQEVLDNMKKNMKVERIRQFFKDAKKAGILIHGCFLLGNPGETKETLKVTLNFAKELGPDTAQFFPIMVYPGTEAYNWAKDRGYLKTEDFKQWLTDDGLHNCVVSRPGLTDKELVEFCDNARQQFYLRPSFIVKKLIEGVSHPSEFMRLLRGGGSLIRYIIKGSFGPRKGEA